MGIRGAILGDMAGEPYEFCLSRPSVKDNYNIITGNSIFTDDSVMSVATMCAVHDKFQFSKWYRLLGLAYPDAGYGGAFREWIHAERTGPYNSWGNGSAMRASYIGQYLAKSDDVDEVKKTATLSAECTHNHPEGIKGAVVLAVCVWMAEKGYSGDDILEYAIKEYPVSDYQYSPSIPVSEYANTITWDVSCQVSVPVAIRCFYDTENFIECMKLINSMSCDADTLGAIAGAICESFYGNCLGSEEVDKLTLRRQLSSDKAADMYKTVLPADIKLIRRRAETNDSDRTLTFFEGRTAKYTDKPASPIIDYLIKYHIL